MRRTAEGYASSFASLNGEFISSVSEKTEKKKKSIKILISKFIKWVIKIDIMTFILSMYGKRAGGKQRLKKQYLHKAAQVSIALVKNAGSKKQQQKISSAQNHQICAQGLAFPSLHLILTHTHERSLSCPAM